MQLINHIAMSFTVVCDLSQDQFADSDVRFC